MLTDGQRWPSICKGPGAGVCLHVWFREDRKSVGLQQSDQAGAEQDGRTVQGREGNSGRAFGAIVRT